MEENKLKPVIFVQGSTKGFYAQNTFAQNILLKAMSEGITNPNELRKIAGFKATADVFRTLDKIAIRKEYHEALQRNGISLDYIVEGLKDIADSGEDDKVRLASLNTILKSIGLEKYEKDVDSGKSWEDTVLSAIAKEDRTKQLGDGNVIEGETIEYEVNRPDVPEIEKKQREDEAALAKMLYGE